MRSICWLHISDIHLRERDAWSQDVVLKAMCDHIAHQRALGTTADFILVTGDIAFSGKAGEYALAAGFFDALGAAAAIPKERIYCVPGNHDIDRDRQRLCFQGARAALHDQNRIDALLAGGEDLETLLKRQENYRQFQSSYFAGQDRSWTGDGLGYVSRLTIEDVRLAILGLDSAWIANGGLDDHGKLAIGERQVINALKLAQEHNDPPHIILGMAHHPFHLFQDFDRRLVEPH
ncbi:MAG: metallophosphoesterase family protein [Burkholderiales bacterium]